ncbi:probable uridine nucleosidase 2, partial [Cucurbita moschata]
IFGDPEAADMVFTSGADVLVVGLNVTHQVVMTEADRDKLGRSDGKFAKYLCKILDIYFSYHRYAYETKGVYLHDPATVVAAVDPSLFTYTEGVVRVQTTGISRGLTILYNNKKRFGEVSEWCDKPTVKVAVTVDAPAVLKLVMDRLIDS